MTPKELRERYEKETGGTTEFRTLVSSIYAEWLESRLSEMEKEKKDGIDAFYQEHDIVPLDSPEIKAFDNVWAAISHEVWKRDPIVVSLTRQLSESQKSLAEARKKSKEWQDALHACDEALRLSQRKAEALDWLEKIFRANKDDYEIHFKVMKNSISEMVIFWGDDFGSTAPTLLEAIEKASAGR